MKHAADIRALGGLLAAFRFTQPAPPEVKKILSASKQDVFVRVLKTAGAYTLGYALFIWLFFLMKKAGVWAIIAKTAVAAAAAASVAYGGYRAVIGFRGLPSATAPAVVPAVKETPVEKSPPDPVEIKKETPVLKYEKIILYDGREIIGAVIGRGGVYKISTKNGIMSLPADKIQRIVPLQ